MGSQAKQPRNKRSADPRVTVEGEGRIAADTPCDQQLNCQTMLESRPAQGRRASMRGHFRPWRQPHCCSWGACSNGSIAGDPAQALQQSSSIYQLDILNLNQAALTIALPDAMELS